jgi:hypothetical protein
MPGTPRKLKRGPRHAVRALHFATAVLFSRRAKAGWVLFWNYGITVTVHLTSSFN